MSKVRFHRLLLMFMMLIVGTVAALTLTGTLDSEALLGGVIIAGIVVLSFQLGMQYQRLAAQNR